MPLTVVLASVAHGPRLRPPPTATLPPLPTTIPPPMPLGPLPPLAPLPSAEGPLAPAEQASGSSSTQQKDRDQSFICVSPLLVCVRGIRGPTLPVRSFR